MKVMTWFLVTCALLVAAVFTARHVYVLPSLEGRSETVVIAASAETPLGAAVLAQAAGHTDKSGVRSLRSGLEAYAARVLLTRAAQDSIDVSSYIWKDDMTGMLLLDELRQAADRGVRVRLLVDDNGTSRLDPELVALDGHPNAEVRLFNPFVLRNPRFLSFGFDFVRLNRRMHNKSFTVDGVATVIGGRNIGDIYFDSGADMNFMDFDVLAVGQAAADVGTDFDAYWASASAYPAHLLIEPHPGGLEQLAQEAAALRRSVAASEYEASLRATPLVRNLLDRTLGLEWVGVQLVSDDPAKGLGLARRDGLMISRLGGILGGPARSVDLVSAYFVPGARGEALLADWARQGLRVRVLTNAQEATDVVPVHSGYIKHREGLLDAGVRMFELKARPDRSGQKDKFGVLGSSTSSLHAKTFTVDDERIFIGSFNFDPRSAFLNTEMGFLIESPAMARELAQVFDGEVGLNAYEARRGADGSLEWLDHGPDGATLHHTVEPGTTGLTRGLVRFISWLPIDWML